MNRTPMDIIFITDLRADAIIGIYERERTTKQTISVDLELGTSVKDAALNDNVEDTLNYKLLSKRVEAYIQQSEFQLIETLAERLAEIILREFNVPWLKLTLHKVGALSNSGDVGVRIIRHKT
ncbi:MAG: dihydroneopterin aldolase [Granulosicoccaceae bacterium]